MISHAAGLGNRHREWSVDGEFPVLSLRVAHGRCPSAPFFLRPHWDKVYQALTNVMAGS